MKNIYFSTVTQATQVDFNLSQTNKKSYKNRFVQCDCSASKIDAAVSKVNLLKECNSPLVIISVYPRQGETENADYCPVKIVQHQNISKNKIQTKLATEEFNDNQKQKRDRTPLRNKAERLRYSRSPSPAIKTEKVNTNRNKDSYALPMSSASRKPSPENKNFKVPNKPNEFKKDMPSFNEQNKYNKTSKKQSNKFERKNPKTNAEQVKKALVSDFIKNIDTIDKQQPKRKIINAKDDASKITINIDGDNEYYDVTFERSDLDTGVSVRKTAKDRNQRKADTSSLRNFLMLSDDSITKASYSRVRCLICTYFF